MTNNPLIAPSLGDELEERDGRLVYKYDCHNAPICKSYGEIAYACLAGSKDGSRCSLWEKMQIRILNDANPNAIYKPEKPSLSQITDYVEG